jgi:hypothetical protein
MLIWLVLLIYVNANEQSLLKKVADAVHKRTKGDVKIGGLSVSFFRTFPVLSLQLKDVVLKDSVYHLHHKELLTAKDIYLRASISGLITHKDVIGKVILSDGAINLVTDSSGNTNEYVLKSSKNDKQSGKFSMPDIILKSMIINYQNLKRKKHYYGIVKTLRCNTTLNGPMVFFKLRLGMLVKNISFNTIRGAYLKEKYVDGSFTLAYNSQTMDIIVHRVTLNVDDHPFHFEGKFNVDNNVANFNLNITTQNIVYTTATSFLTDSLSRRLNEYTVLKPIGFTVKIAGKTNSAAIPLIQAWATLKNNEVITPQGVFEDCSLKGYYTNEVIKGKPRLDENSLLEFKNVSAQWEKILVYSKKVKFSNLVTPFLECDIASSVDMKALNRLSGSSSLQFLKGSTSVKIEFKGPIMGEDSTASNINGEINFYDASIKYLPRNFLLSGCEGYLKFINNDLYVNKLTATTGKTKLQMKGSAKNFLSLLNISPEKLVLDWTVTSPTLHLSDFKAFLSKTVNSKPEKHEAKFSAASSKVDKMFADADMYINFDVPQMDYKSFRATNVKATVIMKRTEIAFENVSFNHAKGFMTVRGFMKNGERANPVHLKTVMHDMDIPTLFEAFNNFGQDAVTFKNLKGKLTADVDFNTAITNNAEIISSASEGSIHFVLENGELNNFEPLLEISKKAFKKQDFSQIKFADLRNKLDVKGTTFIVNPMDIRSTALNLSVEGIYDFKKGTDMSIKFPLTNLTKSQANTDISDDGKRKKGVSLRLRAKTGDDGKLKVTWDPFRKSIKNKQDIKDSTQVKN